ncbi:hypothetical protein [Pleionea sediminis]|uniref:hypothetical protein n=1 Tax=Pleionea sediminis TaxID=2569479 RepID=UPI0011872653|nr:hypothetical protein [Pleionea sediminis]
MVDSTKFNNLSEQEKIKEVFRNIRNLLSVIETKSVSIDWLDNVESDALKGHSWVNSVNGYFQGLRAARVISVIELQALDELLFSFGYLK